MLRRLILGTVLIAAVTATLQARTKLYYLEFNTVTYEELEKQLATMELAGVRAAHIFPPNAVIAEVPTGSIGVMEKGAGITIVVDPEHSESSVFDPANRLAFDVWCGPRSVALRPAPEDNFAYTLRGRKTNESNENHET